MVLRAVIAFVAAISLLSSAALAEKRVALVIGNGAYANVASLDNPKNDAAAMEAIFKAAGFNAVVRANDLGVAAMRRALRDFSDIAYDADVAVVFYAGHGIEVSGINYLIPTDAVLERDIDLQDEAIPLDRVNQTLERVKHLRLVILDACRDNPFVRSMRRTLATRTVRSGHGEIDERSLPPNTLVAYAQRAGALAEDGAGANSPYTTALIKHLPTPGLDVELALRRVRDEVLKATRNRQEPFKYGSLGGTEVALVAAKAKPNVPLEENIAATSITALPAPEQKSLAITLVTKFGESKSWLGVVLKDLEPSTAQGIGLPREGGALVTKVNENSPASFAGLQPGDLIESIAQARVLNGTALARLVQSTPPGKKVEIVLWRSGNGVEDLKGWLQSKAANNNTQAMRFLALGYATELFGSASASEALKWTQMAANGGDVEAMVEMGSIHESGMHGVVKDRAQAARWYKRAVDTRSDYGIRVAARLLAPFYASGVSGFPEDLAESVRLYRMSAEAGDARGMVGLAFAYRDGSGVPKDESEAARWLRKAADLRDYFALADLAELYRQGKGVPKDAKQAVELFRQSAEGGAWTGMRELGYMYERGEQVVRDPITASHWMFKAIQHGFLGAYIELNPARNGDASKLSIQFRREFQRRLQEAKFYDGPINGTFDDKTIEAIIKMAGIVFDRSGR